MCQSVCVSCGEGISGEDVLTPFAVIDGEIECVHTMCGIPEHWVHDQVSYFSTRKKATQVE